MKANNNKNKDIFSIFIIIVFFISIVSFGIYMLNGIEAYSYQEWGQVVLSNEKEEQEWQENKEVSKYRSEKAKDNLVKYDTLYKEIAVGCALLGIILTVIAIDRKKKEVLHVILTIIMILGALLYFL